MYSAALGWLLAAVFHFRMIETMCAHHHCSRCYLLQAAPDLFTLVCSVSWEILSTHVCLYVSRKAGVGTEPRTFSKWGICANHCSTMPPNTQENTGALAALQKHLYSCLTTIYASKSVSYEVNKCSMTNPNYWMSETGKIVMPLVHAVIHQEKVKIPYW